MIHRIISLLNIIFPPSQAGLLLSSYTQPTLTEQYCETSTPQVTTLSSYNTPIIKAAVTAGKFEKNWSGLSLLATLVTEYCTRHQLHNAHTIFVPIPLHSTRQKERGYNQITEIIKLANKATPSPYTITPLLVRQKATKVQSHLPRVERVTNMSDAFIYQKLNLKWQEVTTVILLDDVYTTGTTMAEAKKVLKKNLPRHVTLLCIALAQA